MRKKNTLINVVCSLAVLATNMFINFYLSPYIIENVGVAANGFVTLANNFVTYANLTVVALNAMAARFITIECTKGNYEKANIYYNSVFWGNLIIVAVLFLPSAFFIVRIGHILDVPADILRDVQILFTFVFLNFYLSTGFPNWDCGTYVTNRLDRYYIPQMFASITRCVLLLVLFGVFFPHVWYVGFAATVMTIMQLAANGYNTYKLTPYLRVRLRKGHKIYSAQAVRELVGSGIWSTFSNLGNLLLSGLDILICNIALGATEMGVLAVSKILYNLMGQLASALKQAFAAEFTIDYAKGDKEILLQHLQSGIKIVTVIMTVPISGIIVLADKFYELWVPSQDAHLLHILTILSLLSYLFTCPVNVLFNVFSTVNKVKPHAIAVLISGVISVVLTLLLAQRSEYALYAIAGVSSVINLIRNITFSTIAPAHYLGYKWYQFYPALFYAIICNGIIIALGTGVRHFINIHSWTTLFICAAVIAGAGFAVNCFVVLNKSDRERMKSMICNKIHI